MSPDATCSGIVKLKNNQKMKRQTALKRFVQEDFSKIPKAQKIGEDAIKPYQEDAHKWVHPLRK